MIGIENRGLDGEISLRVTDGIEAVDSHLGCSGSFATIRPPAVSMVKGMGR